MSSKSLPPLFCHVHIPKTGGTTLNTLLSSWFPSAFEVIHHPNPNFVLQIEDLAARLSQEPFLRCICTHHLRNFPSTINGRRVHYFTMLRDPLDRTISVMTFMKKFFNDLSKEHQASVTSTFEQMAELDVLKLWTADLTIADDNCVLPGNPVTAMLLDSRFQCDFVSNRRTCEVAAAAKCISILNRFLYVGDFACFDESVRELARRIRALGASACETEHIPTERISRDIRGDLGWLEKGAPVVNAYMDGLMIDGMVYRHFAQWNRHSAQA